jgi:hypothetical protein
VPKTLKKVKRNLEEFGRNFLCNTNPKKDSLHFVDIHEEKEKPL